MVCTTELTLIELQASPGPPGRTEWRAEWPQQTISSKFVPSIELCAGHLFSGSSPCNRPSALAEVDIPTLHQHSCMHELLRELGRSCQQWKGLAVVHAALAVAEGGNQHSHRSEQSEEKAEGRLQRGAEEQDRNDNGVHWSAEEIVDGDSILIFHKLALDCRSRWKVRTHAKLEHHEGGEVQVHRRIRDADDCRNRQSDGGQSSDAENNVDVAEAGAQPVDRGAAHASHHVCREDQAARQQAVVAIWRERWGPTEDEDEH
mmetsp:Transcript_120127/g.299677  ORF Transcript_120127/g.299677 Transcript_120127/m.299677 type:complete len:260 (-) Transcript_120127:891-1670(-)